MSGGPEDQPGATRPDDTADESADNAAEDTVDEASEESFPASDAPQGWAGPAGG